MRRIQSSKYPIAYILALFTVLNMRAQVEPGIEFDLQNFIDQKIDAGETNILVPPGRYRVSANGKNAHLNFNDLNAITIVADNVEMICTETYRQFKLTTAQTLN